MLLPSPYDQHHLEFADAVWILAAALEVNAGKAAGQEAITAYGIAKNLDFSGFPSIHSIEDERKRFRVGAKLVEEALKFFTTLHLIENKEGALFLLTDALAWYERYQENSEAAYEILVNEFQNGGLPTSLEEETTDDGAVESNESQPEFQNTANNADDLWSKPPTTDAHNPDDDKAALSNAHMDEDDESQVAAISEFADTDNSDETPVATDFNSEQAASELPSHSSFSADKNAEDENNAITHPSAGDNPTSASYQAHSNAPELEQSTNADETSRNEPPSAWSYFNEQNPASSEASSDEQLQAEEDKPATHPRRGGAMGRKIDESPTMKHDSPDETANENITADGFTRQGRTAGREVESGKQAGGRYQRLSQAIKPKSVADENEQAPDDFAHGNDSDVSPKFEREPRNPTSKATEGGRRASRAEKQEEDSTQFSGGRNQTNTPANPDRSTGGRRRSEASESSTESAKDNVDKPPKRLTSNPSTASGADFSPNRKRSGGANSQEKGSDEFNPRRMAAANDNTTNRRRSGGNVAPQDDAVVIRIDNREIRVPQKIFNEMVEEHGYEKALALLRSQI